MIRYILGVVVFSLILVGCGDKKINMSTEEEAKISVEEIRQSLSKEDKELFDNSIKKIALKEAAVAKTQQDAINNFKAKINGKTAKEIIEMGQ